MGCAGEKCLRGLVAKQRERSLGIRRSKWEDNIVMDCTEQEVDFINVTEDGVSGGLLLKRH